jgi:hypothetical protein
VGKLDKKKIFLGILGVILLVMGTAYYIFVMTPSKNPPVVIFEKSQSEQKVEKGKITLYVPDEKLEKLNTIDIEVETDTNGEMGIDQIFELLKSQMDYKFQYKSESSEKIEEAPFLEEGVKLLNTYRDGMDIYLNFNYRFKENMRTPNQELLIIYSLVNTIIEAGKCERVKILVNNQEIEKLNFYKLSKFYEKNFEI